MLSAQFVALYKPHKPKLNLQDLVLASNIIMTKQSVQVLIFVNSTSLNLTPVLY